MTCLSIHIGKINSVYFIYNHSNLIKQSQWILYASDSVTQMWCLYFTLCPVIWFELPSKLAHPLVCLLQMEPFCSTCWLTFPKLTEHFFLQKKCTRTYNGVISIIEAILDKTQGCLLIDLLVSFCVVSSYNLPNDSLLWFNLSSSCCYWHDHWELNMKTRNQMWNTAGGKKAFFWTYLCLDTVIL